MQQVNPVNSVNTKVGVVVIDPDDLNDSATTNKFATAAQLAKVDHLTVTGAKNLDNIEDNADVTDATNVDAAGAVMNTDTSTAAMSFVIDEDNMASDSPTKVPTQQSVKAYVDASGGGGTVDTSGVPVANDFARFTDADTIEGRSYAEARADLSLEPGTDIQAALAEGVFADGDKTKLDGIETGADVTDATNVAAAGAIMDGDFSTNGLMKRTAAGTYATATADTDYQSVPAEGAFADGDKTKLDAISGTNTGDEAAASATVAGVVELATIAEVDTGTDTARAITPAGLAGSALQTKVDGIETSADVTDETNVKAALDGATISTATVATGDKVLIQDADDADNLKTVTAQSIADLAAASGFSYEGAYNASTNTPDLDTSPSGISKGDCYEVSAAGAFFATTVDDGDVLIAKQDSPTTAAHWMIIQGLVSSAEVLSWLNGATISSATPVSSDNLLFQDATASDNLRTATLADAVTAAGAVMESDTSTASMSFVVDEDDMSSDSATKIPTQQSVKAYADASYNNLTRSTTQTLTAGDYDDWNLGGATEDVVVIDTAQLFPQLTGISISQSAGDVVRIHNQEASTSNTGLIIHSEATSMGSNSTAANRIKLPGRMHTMMLSQGESITLWYDGTNSIWTVIAWTGDYSSQAPYELDFTEWNASEVVALGDTRIPTASNNYWYECTTAGTTNGSEPTWDTTPGGTTTDNTVTWTTRRAWFGLHYLLKLTDVDADFIPDASSDEYQRMMVRCDAANTKILSVNPQSSDTIGGGAYYKMIADEYVELAGSGTSDIQIINRVGTVFVSADSDAGQSLTASTTDMQFEDNQIDNHQAFSSNTTFTAPRDGLYHCVMVYDSTSSSSGIVAELYVNGTKTRNSPHRIGVANALGGGYASLELNAGDTVKWRLNSTVTRRAFQANNYCMYTESA